METARETDNFSTLLCMTKKYFNEKLDEVSSSRDTTQLFTSKKKICGVLNDFFPCKIKIIPPSERGTSFVYYKVTKG